MSSDDDEQSRVCSVCGEVWVDGREALRDRGGESLEARRVCVVSFPEEVVIHFADGEVADE